MGTKIRQYNLRQRYGLSIEDFNRMLKKQKGRCAICKAKDAKMSVDHCHSKKSVRGLLCNSCNLAIGYLKDSQDNLLSALKYLIFWSIG